MFKEMKKRIKNEKGLTLIELLAVIVILAIIAAIAIPAIGNIINNSREKAIISEGLNIISGAKIAKMDNICDGDSNACDNETIGADYVEGVTGDDVTYTAAYDGTDWNLTFSKFTDGFRDDSKYAVEDGVTETELKEALEGKKE